MDQSEAEKWAMGAEFPPDVDKQTGPGPGEVPGGTPGSTTMGGAGGAPGWARQSARFLHVAVPLRHTRFVHESVITRLTPEDIKKAREAKQGTAKITRQKVRVPDMAHIPALGVSLCCHMVQAPTQAYGRRRDIL